MYFLASFERQSLSLYWKDALTISFTLSFFILLYALPAAHIQINLDLDCLPRTRSTHYKPEVHFLNKFFSSASAVTDP